MNKEAWVVFDPTCKLYIKYEYDQVINEDVLTFVKSFWLATIFPEKWLAEREALPSCVVKRITVED